MNRGFTVVIYLSYGMPPRRIRSPDDDVKVQMQNSTQDGKRVLGERGRWVK